MYQLIAWFCHIFQIELCKPWLSVAPTYGMLIPGEKTEIELTITIDNSTAHKLNTSREVLEDILILRLENGRDYYISVTGKYARSCFGMSVDELVLYTAPIREVPLDPILRAEKYDLNARAAMCVPKELWRIIDAIYERGLDERDLFTAVGDPDEVYQVRECLDTRSFRRWISMRKMYNHLRGSFWRTCYPVPYNVFIYIISVFREVLHRQRNRLSTAKVVR